VQRQPDGFGAFIDTADWAVLCASHELFFTREGSRIVSRPMKGTAARGADQSEDQAQAAWLAASAKNRAENLMITDMVRNDLGRIARTGSVHCHDVFALERHPTLWQMTSTVTAESDAGLAELLRALFPAASITGAPKRRAMEIIRELETTPRELYTGSIGYLRPDGSAQFNVAIRTVLVDKATGSAEYGVGGGIVWDSDPDAEHAESRTKALILGAGTPPFELLETLRWTPDAGFLNRTEHLARLAAGADHFGYAFDIEHVTEALAAAARAFPPRPRRVRLLLDRSGRISVTDTDLSPLPTDYRVALCPVPSPVIRNPFVLHKTTHRVLHDQARNLVPGVDDVLLWNERGELTESTIANVVLELDGEWVTPPVASGLLPGVGRRLLLESGQVRERVITTTDLQRATGITLVNSLRGRWPVRLVDQSPDRR
jgi:para-aminobenzoate synthetase/4-amino-4-deoxychorismate lyase